MYMQWINTSASSQLALTSHRSAWRQPAFIAHKNCVHYSKPVRNTPWDWIFVTPGCVQNTLYGDNVDAIFEGTAAAGQNCTGNFWYHQMYGYDSELIVQYVPILKGRYAIPTAGIPTRRHLTGYVANLFVLICEIWWRGKLWFGKPTVWGLNGISMTSYASQLWDISYKDACNNWETRHIIKHTPECGSHGPQGKQKNLAGHFASFMDYAF